MLWLQRQAHVHGTLEIVASGALSRATRPASSGLSGASSRPSGRLLWRPHSHGVRNAASVPPSLGSIQPAVESLAAAECALCVYGSAAASFS